VITAQAAVSRGGSKACSPGEPRSGGSRGGGDEIRHVIATATAAAEGKLTRLVGGQVSSVPKIGADGELNYSFACLIGLPWSWHADRHSPCGPLASRKPGCVGIGAPPGRRRCRDCRALGSADTHCTALQLRPPSHPCHPTPHTALASQVEPLRPPSPLQMVFPLPPWFLGLAPPAFQP
jgi:hypothetical protein